MACGAGIAAAGALGAAGVGYAASQPSSETKTLENQEATNAATGGQYASTLIPQSEQALGQAQNFWQSVMSGNPQAVQGQIASQVNQVNQQTATATKNALEFTPRGGGQSEVLSQIPYAQSNSVQGLINSLTAQAPEQLASIGSSEGSIAAQALGQSTSAASQGISAQQTQQQLGMQAASSVGEGIGGLLSDYLLYEQNQNLSNNLNAYLLGGGGNSGGGNSGGGEPVLLNPNGNAYPMGGGS